MQLKRFSFVNNNVQRIETVVDFPLFDLDIAKIVVKTDPSETLPKYNLFAVSVCKYSLFLFFYSLLFCF
jgi:hypothetical protein